MAVEFTKETQKFRWNTNSHAFHSFKKPWNEAELARVNAKISDSCNVTDHLKNGIALKKQEVFRTIEHFNKNHTLSENEIIRLLESNRKQILNFQHERFMLSEIKKSNLSRPFKENIYLKSKTSNNPILKKREFIRFAEKYWDYVNFVLDIAEMLAVNDATKKSNAIKKLEQLKTSDKLSRNKVQAIRENVFINEKYGSVIAFLRLFAETIKTLSATKKHTSCEKKEKLRVVERKINNPSKKQYEDFGISELFKKYVPIVRKIYETINLSENCGKQVSISQKELLYVLDVLMRASEGVLSDVIIQKGGITLEEFLASVEAPSLHQPFTEFKVGEYEYQDALVRVVLQSTSREMNPSITACIMNIDIPDTDDRGTVKITNTTAATKVHFNRFYYNAPEVVVTLIGGSTAGGTIIPNIVSTELQDDEGRYFEVELLKIDGSRTTGTISWASKGY